MLAELAAANAAFAIIKKTIQNTGDLTRCGKAISDLIIAKEELKRKSNRASDKDIENHMRAELSFYKIPKQDRNYQKKLINKKQITKEQRNVQSKI